MKSKRGKQMMTVKRRTDTVARVIDRLAELKVNKPKAPRNRKPKSRKQKIDNGFSSTANFSAPAAYGSSTRVTKPNFGAKKTIVKHSEYIGDVLGSVAFTIQKTLNCNPGLPNSFPWLSQIALAYEKFCIKNIRYRFETEAPTSFTGCILLSPEYNPQDAIPVSKMEIFQNENTAKSVPWRGVSCPIPTKYLKVYNDYFVRGGALTANKDLKTYDPLVMYVCTQGQTGAGMIGEIWVDYEIELINPIGNMAANGVMAMSTYGATVDVAPFLNLQVAGNMGFSSSDGVTAQIDNAVIGQEYQILMTAWGSDLSALTLTITGATTTSGNYSMIGPGSDSVNANYNVVATDQTFSFTSTIVDSVVTQVFVTVLPLPPNNLF
jgi:hypothetical protein